MDVLAPDIVMVADGGGLVPAFKHPVKGRDRAVALLSRFPQLVPGARVATLLLNGAVAARIRPAADIDAVLTFVVEHGRISRIYTIVNPQKLRRLEKVTDLRR
jgi:RNA polymerase sigma-70 factor (ECF subfamily)